MIHLVKTALPRRRHAALGSAALLISGLALSTLVAKHLRKILKIDFYASKDQGLSPRVTFEGAKRVGNPLPKKLIFFFMYNISLTSVCPATFLPISNERLRH